MEVVMNIVKFITAHLDEMIGAADLLLAALIAVFLLIPGEQPEKALRGIADFLSKFSRKPKV